MSPDRPWKSTRLLSASATAAALLVGITTLALGQSPVQVPAPEPGVFPAPSAPQADGWLEGTVTDYGGTNPTCTDATVHIEPGSLDVAVDASGYYTASLAPFTYTVSASAADYPRADGPYTVTIAAGLTTTQDFVLDRPDVAIAPLSLTASITATGTATRTFTISNTGSYTLTYEIFEKQPQTSSPDASQVLGEPGIEVEVELQAEMAAAGSAGYLIYFRARPDLSPAYGMDWIERGRFVMKALQETAQRSQARVRAHLDARGADHQSFWIDNVIVVSSSGRATLDGLLVYPEIEALRARRHPTLIEPVERGSASSSPAAVEPNLSHVGADQVWADFGVTGAGIVVASIDTGVRYTHQALVGQYRGNLGGGSFDHDYNWWDPITGTQYLVPTDYHPSSSGHGSHTTGIMVGDDGSGNQIGMAPGAQWIACRGFEASDDSDLLECGQFMAAPWDLTGANPDPDLRPHVVNNSWGDSYPCPFTYNTWYQGVIDSWLAAGIYPVFANGNTANCGLSSAACDTVGNPARAGNVTGVGSTGQSNGQLASHSLWGPTDDPDTVNPRGYPTLKPQVVAPGEFIRSAHVASDSSYTSRTGTSMSAPHVSGLVALMWEAAPCLIGDYANTETIIEQTATPIPYASDCSGEGPGNVPNYATGWGEIDAYAAVEAAVEHCQLPWASADPISGTLPSGSQIVEVRFTCTLTDSLPSQPLQGALLVRHDDPCQDPLEIGLELFCTSRRWYLPVALRQQ